MLSAYVVAAFLGDYPRDDFVAALDSFTSGGARRAAERPRRGHGAGFGTAGGGRRHPAGRPPVDRSLPTRRPSGVSAAVHFEFDVADDGVDRAGPGGGPADADARGRRVEDLRLRPRRDPTRGWRREQARRWRRGVPRRGCAAARAGLRPRHRSLSAWSGSTRRQAVDFEDGVVVGARAGFRRPGSGPARGQRRRHRADRAGPRDRRRRLALGIPRDTVGRRATATSRRRSTPRSWWAGPS